MMIMYAGQSRSQFLLLQDNQTIHVFCQCGSTCSRIENNVTPELLGVSLTSQQILVIEEQNEGHDPTNNAFSLS